MFLIFWFNQLEEKQWWVKDPELDQMISDKFGDTLQKAARGELYSWRETTKGRLAEIIVLDQFSRNIYRDQAMAFAADPVAVILAQEFRRSGGDQELTPTERSFGYMPLMHSESLIIHDQAVEAFAQRGLEGSLDFEYKHRDIIIQFGRYPHRNKILGRESTQEELQFLDGPGSSF